MSNVKFFVIIFVSLFSQVNATAAEQSGGFHVLSSKGSVSFQLKPMGHCLTLGDLDIARFDLLRSSNKRWIVSLEPLSQGDKPLYVNDLPLGRLLSEEGNSLKQRTGGEFLMKDPYRFKVDLSKVKSPAAFGLFVCRDSSMTKRCLGKAYKDMDSVFNIENPKSNSVIKNDREDRIYYFQPIFLLGEQVTTFQSKSEPGIVQPFFGENVARQIGEIDDTLKSYRLGVVDQLVTVFLPYKNGAHMSCMLGPTK